MTALAPGENRPLPGEQVTITVGCAVGVDVSALLLGPWGTVRSDADFVFFNNPVAPGVSYHHGRGRGDVVQVDTRALPPDVTAVAVTASLDGSGPPTFAGAGPLVATVGPLTFEMAGLSTESAVVCVEVYRRGEQWKVRAVGQGYADGLAGLAREFGVDVDAEPAPQPAPDPPAPAAPAPPVPQPPVPQTPVPQPPVPPPPVPQPPVPQPPAPPPPRGASPVHSDLFSPDHAEVAGSGIQKQGGKMARVAMNGEVMARAGSMVAYQGELRFEALGAGGIGNMIRQRVTGEGVPLMRVSGRGDLFLANAASDVHLIDLDGSDGLTINGANVLAFDSTLSYTIGRVSGAAGFASNAGLVQLRVHRARPDRDHHRRDAGRAQRRSADLRRSAGRGRVVVEPANRVEEQRLVQPGHPVGAQHRGAGHALVRRAGFRHRAALRASPRRVPRRHRRRRAGRHRRRHAGRPARPLGSVNARPRSPSLHQAAVTRPAWCDEGLRGAAQTAITVGTIMGRRR